MKRFFAALGRKAPIADTKESAAITAAMLDQRLAAKSHHANCCGILCVTERTMMGWHKNSAVIERVLKLSIEKL
jgi:hypothetical protein